MEHHVDAEYEDAEVLVIAKTYPNMSREYTELVCTAGLRIDTYPYQWIRLYPVPYRLLEQDSQYKKWQVIKVKIVKRTGDLRPESYQPKPNSIEPIGKAIPTTDGWRKRVEYLKGFMGQTTACQLLQGAKDRKTDSQSLGLVHVRKIINVNLQANNSFFTEKAKQKRETRIITLFGTEFKTVLPSPFTLKYKYYCDNPNCKSHNQSLIDWEFGASGFNCLKKGTEHARNILEQQFIKNPTNENKDLWFILGNAHKHPQDFMILGLFYPSKDALKKSTMSLFDV